MQAHKLSQPGWLLMQNVWERVNVSTEPDQPQPTQVGNHIHLQLAGCKVQNTATHPRLGGLLANMLVLMKRNPGYPLVCQVDG